jgi:hypothetical protein
VLSGCNQKHALLVAKQATALKARVVALEKQAPPLDSGPVEVAKL